MRLTTAQTEGAWLSGDYVGENRAMMRATIQNLSVIVRGVGVQNFASMIFGQLAETVELPNIKSIQYNKTIDADANTMTMVLYNTEPLPLGAIPDALDDQLGQPGYYTFNRGVNSWSLSKWGHTTNGWQNRIVPDRIIRTYEGFGYDPTLGPDLDPHMYLSGVWRIDDVSTDTTGLITVECRDLAGVLVDEIFFPPVVPFSQYPLQFTKIVPVQNPDIVTTSGSSTWKHPAYSFDSGVPYVGVNGSVYGHHGTDAFDTSGSSYWLSIGNDRPNVDYAYEFIEGKFGKNTLSAVKFHVWGGPYTCYISVFADGKWQGRSTVPYNSHAAPAAPNHANIRFVHALNVGKGETVTHKFKIPWKKATKVRVTFHHLYNSGLGPFPYRAGMRDFMISVGTSVTTTTDGGTHFEGNYNDYTDLIKLFCAYGGFWWPKSSTDAVQRLTDGSIYVHPAPSDDHFLKEGMIWGDIQTSGTVGKTALGVDIWDKKSLKDGINYIKDIIGFNFFIDDYGSVVWRLPNVYQRGNYVSAGGPHTQYLDDYVTIDEEQTLIGLTAKLSSRSIREKVFIANTDGQYGAVVNGHFNNTSGPFTSGLRRVSGWTDEHFQTTGECLSMADLVALQQLFTYRTDSVTVVGNPAIQIDDQVWLTERVTEENGLHYVQGIQCEWDLEKNRYVYTLDTHWLGQEPFGKWVFDPKNLSADTQAYLHILGVHF